MFFRRVVINNENEMPTEYGTTPGGTIFGTTPGGKFEQKLINYSNQIQCWSFFKKYIYI